ncbi:MAG: chorismate mutase, partial [Dehalococcoidia bacterium]
MPKDKAKALSELANLRQKIDELDSQIVELLNKRAEVVVEVGKAKSAHGTPSYALGREHAVLERIAEFNKGPLPQQTLQAIYRELMSGSFRLEKPLRIGYLGPEGSFSQMAAERKFG